MSQIAGGTGFPQVIKESIKERRLKMARLPVEEKFRILLRMQRIAAEAARARGGTARQPWQMD